MNGGLGGKRIRAGRLLVVAGFFLFLLCFVQRERLVNAEQQGSSSVETETFFYLDSPSSCPPGFLHSRFARKCFAFSRAVNSFDQCSDACFALGGAGVASSSSLDPSALGWLRFAFQARDGVDSVPVAAWIGIYRNVFSPKRVIQEGMRVAGL